MSHRLQDGWGMLCLAIRVPFHAIQDRRRYFCRRHTAGYAWHSSIKCAKLETRLPKQQKADLYTHWVKHRNDFAASQSSWVSYPTATQHLAFTINLWLRFCPEVVGTFAAKYRTYSTKRPQSVVFRQDILSSKTEVSRVTFHISFATHRPTLHTYDSNSNTHNSLHKI